MPHQTDILYMLYDHISFDFRKYTVLFLHLGLYPSVLIIPNKYPCMKDKYERINTQYNLDGTKSEQTLQSVSAIRYAFKLAFRRWKLWDCTFICRCRFYCLFMSKVHTTQIQWEGHHRPI